MKKKIYLIALLIAASTSFIVDGCKKKDDDEPEDARNKFVATYGVTENGTENGVPFSNYHFDISVTKSSTAASDILISNFGGYGFTCKATVAGGNVTIPQQTQTINQIASGISGSGSISGNTFTFDYHVSQGTGSIDAHDIAVKK